MNISHILKKILKWTAIMLGILLVVALVVPLLIPIPPLSDTRSPEQLADSDSLFIEVEGLKVHYKMVGKGRTALILLHGFGASLFSWREVMAPLSELGMVVAYDRPAFGLTQRPVPGTWTGENPYSPQFQPVLLVGLMDALHIDQAILIGNSAGGTVALQTALAYPKRVKALVLVDAAVYGGGPGSTLTRFFYNTPQADRLGVLLVRNIQSWGEELIARAWHDPSRLNEAVRVGYRKPLQAENWDRALWELTKASENLKLNEHLAEIHQPVLVVTGDDDRIVPTEQSLRLAREMPGAGLVVFKECGHVPHEECPQQFLAAVNPFLAQFKE